MTIFQEDINMSKNGNNGNSKIPWTDQEIKLFLTLREAHLKRIYRNDWTSTKIKQFGKQAKEAADLAQQLKDKMSKSQK